MLYPGIDCNLSTVPPVNPKPLPDILATGTPKDATSGNNIKETLSPTPPVECLSTKILFNFDNTAFYSRLLEGMYPDTDRLIPQSSETEIELNAVSLLHAIERASLLSHEGRNNVVKLSLNSENQTAVLSSNSPEVGNIEEELQFDYIRNLL